MTTFGKRGRLPASPANRPASPPPPASRDPAPDEAEEGGASRVTMALGIAAAAMFAVALLAGALVAFNFVPWDRMIASIGGGRDARGSYVSLLDASCGSGWTKDLPNGKQLQCYLTRNVGRLCNPEERQHLVGVLRQYSADAAVFDRAFAVASLKMLGKVQSQGFKLGYAAAKLQHDGTDPGQQMEDWKEVDSISEDITAAPNEVLRRAKDNVPQYKLVEEVRTLMLKGLISVEDFGWSGNPLVESAQRDIARNQLTVKPICADRRTSG